MLDPCIIDPSVWFHTLSIGEKDNDRPPAGPLCLSPLMLYIDRFDLDRLIQIEMCLANVSVNELRLSLSRRGYFRNQK